MKKPKKCYIVTGLVFLTIGLLCGVYYREFTKALNYSYTYTPLGLVHPHLLVLGLVINIILGLLLANFSLNKKQEKIAFVIYNVGVSLTGLLLLVRGTFDVLSKTNNYMISGTLSTIISGLAGVSHIVLAVGIIYYFVLILKSYKKVD